MLVEKLKKYSRGHFLPMHMPGHKRKKINKFLPYSLDITEIDGFDNLMHEEGVLADCEKKLAKMYSSSHSYFLVNGSTCGILSAIKSVCDLNDKIIIAPNCHKSVYKAIELLNLSYYPLEMTLTDGIFDKVSLESIKKALKKTTPKCVVITSPTYEGVISDIKEISSYLHSKNIPLIVDEAHGAHLFLENLSSVTRGADIVVSSLHKTLPALTQTACIHVNSSLVDYKKVKDEINLFQTSSPSYILMASIDACVEYLQINGVKKYQNYKKTLQKFLEDFKKLKNLKIFSSKEPYDNTKIVLYVPGFSKEVEKFLRQNKIESEMTSKNYIILYSTLMDEKKDFARLLRVLKKLDKNLEGIGKINLGKKTKLVTQENEITIYNARRKPQEEVNLKEAVGRICGEYFYIYPPGVPLLVPGRKITKEDIENIEGKEKINVLTT